MGELLPFINGEIAQTKRGIKMELLKLDGLAEFNNRAGDYEVDLYRRNQLRLQMAPGIEPLLNDLLMNFHLDAVALQKRMLREF